MSKEPADAAEPFGDVKTPRPLFVIRGEASPNEIAVLVAVLQSAAAKHAPAPSVEPRSQWSAPHRGARTSLPSGPSGWRSSALPR